MRTKRTRLREEDLGEPSMDVDYLDDYEGSPQLDEPGPIDWYSSGLMLLIGVVVLVSSIQLDLGSFARPGPGLWPFLNAVLIIALAPVGLFKPHRFDPPNRLELLRVLGIAVPLLVFVPLYEWAGLIGAGAPMLLIVARFVGGLRWRPAIAVALLTPVIVYILFAMLLGVNLRPF